MNKKLLAIVGAVVVVGAVVAFYIGGSDLFQGKVSQVKDIPVTLIGMSHVSKDGNLTVTWTSKVTGDTKNLVYLVEVICKKHKYPASDQVCPKNLNTTVAYKPFSFNKNKKQAAQMIEFSTINPSYLYEIRVTPKLSGFAGASDYKGDSWSLGNVSFPGGGMEPKFFKGSKVGTGIFDPEYKNYKGTNNYYAVKLSWPEVNTNLAKAQSYKVERICLKDKNGKPCPINGFNFSEEKNGIIWADGEGVVVDDLQVIMSHLDYGSNYYFKVYPINQFGTGKPIQSSTFSNEK